MTQVKADDVRYIKRCFELARKGSGNVSPNPMVGAVLVKNGAVVGEGWHEQYGEAHAEVNAFLNAGEQAQGATLYCNLEPCCHSKKQTPPCTPLVISKKVKRVVISNLDPNPHVAGRGVEQIRAAGIKVDVGVLENEGRELNRFFFTSISKNRPYIILKIAQSLDGFISAGAGRQTWLTGKESGQFVHRLRAETDAVLVGANTVKTDDPQLNVRHVSGRNPQRLVLDGRLSTPENARLFNDDACSLTQVFCGEKADPQKIKYLASRGIDVQVLPVDENDQLDLKALLAVLHQKKITSLLVEGGQSLFSQFAARSLFDEIIILQAPVLLGNGLPAFNESVSEKLALESAETLGPDIKMIFHKNAGHLKVK